MREFELVAAQATVERPAPKAKALEHEITALAAEIEGYQRELEQLGISLKDPRMGLVDFPAEIGGRQVWLCWRLGEPAVEYWHELHAGFAGRQRFSPGTLS